jgi:cellulase/cellobiase CelA1
MDISRLVAMRKATRIPFLMHTALDPPRHRALNISALIPFSSKMPVGVCERVQVTGCSWRSWRVPVPDSLF